MPPYLPTQVEVALLKSKRAEAGSRRTPQKGISAETEASETSVGPGSNRSGTVVRFMGSDGELSLEVCLDLFSLVHSNVPSFFIAWTAVGRNAKTALHAPMRS